MAPEDFVLAIKKAAFDSAVADTLHKLQAGPPGRGSHPRGSALSLWYSELGVGDQRMVLEIIRDAAHAAVFGFLCVLDGVRVIDDPPHIDLRLTATGQEGTTTTLAAGSHPVELHDEFNRLVHPPSEHWPPPSENS